MAQLELVRPAPPLESEPRPDHAIITHLVDDGAHVLDVGCGEGALLTLLKRERNIRAAGLERDPAKARLCVVRGLSVAQGDPERDLAAFPAGAFDVVILAHALHGAADPRAVLKAAARAGTRVLITIANAGHWRARARLAFGGRAARWEGAARAISVRDMAELARACRLSIETAVPMSRGRAGAPFAKTLWRANWFAEEAIFLLQP